MPVDTARRPHRQHTLTKSKVSSHTTYASLVLCGGPTTLVILDWSPISQNPTAQPQPISMCCHAHPFHTGSSRTHPLCRGSDPHLSPDNGHVPRPICIVTTAHIRKHKSSHITPRLETRAPPIRPQLFGTGSAAETRQQLLPQGPRKSPRHRPLVTSVAHDAHRRGRKYQNALSK